MTDKQTSRKKSINIRWIFFITNIIVALIGGSVAALLYTIAVSLSSSMKFDYRELLITGFGVFAAVFIYARYNQYKTKKKALKLNLLPKTFHELLEKDNYQDMMKLFTAKFNEESNADKLKEMVSPVLEFIRNSRFYPQTIQHKGLTVMYLGVYVQDEEVLPVGFEVLSEGDRYLLNGIHYGSKLKKQKAGDKEQLESLESPTPDGN